MVELQPMFSGEARIKGYKVLESLDILAFLLIDFVDKMLNQVNYWTNEKERKEIHEKQYS